MRRYYTVLDCSEDATQEQIKKAYRRMNSKLHPDKISSQREVTPEDTQAFQEVLEAYECLSDPEKRAAYDESGATGKEADPVDGTLMHVFQELLEAGAPTAFDLLGTAKEVLSNMIEEASKKLIGFEESLIRVKRIKEKIEYQGKTKDPILFRVIEEVILNLMKEIEDHKAAVNGGKLAYQKLGDYKANDRSAKPPAPRTPKDYQITGMPEEFKLLDAMLRGKRL